MIVVSNSTAIINFSEVGHLEILRSLFGDIIIPQQVFQELKGYTREIIQDCRWIKVKELQSHKSYKYLTNTINLHAGEAAAILLALELDANYLVLDETHARKVAPSILKSTKIISTIQILKIAAERKIIKNHLNILRDMYQAGYYPSSLDKGSII